MKPNVDFPKKAKNSFIFFQIGLIATMLVVLFVLEFNFELKSKKAVVPETITTIDISVPTNFKIIPKMNPIAENKPNAQPKFTNQFKETTKEVPKDKVKPVDNTPKDVDTNAPKESVNENPIKEVPSTKPETPTVLNVEELPMFPACRGLSRNEQLKCFEEQMSKAVAKNAEYPEIDRENGKQGRALISFIIDENGKIIDVKALDNKNATPEMKIAAEKAVRKVSKLTPAKQGGKPVRIKYVIPVSFRL
jgi:TonB family protein